MNFKEYVILEAKSDSELTKNEKEARDRAKSKYGKDSAKWRKMLKLPPRDPIPQRAWSKLRGDASVSGQKEWSKKVRGDVIAFEESKSARKWKHKQARRKADGTLGVPEGERRLRAPYPVQNPGTGSKPYRFDNVKNQRAKRLSKDEL